MPSPSTFIISLDFELFWGVRDQRTIEGYGARIRGEQQVIPALLALFERHSARATFATVGFLFAHHREELMELLPCEKPRYWNDILSPYAGDYLQKIGQSAADDPYHYAAPLLEQIAADPTGHEIASHTFSHFYALEGATLSSFEADVEAAARIAARWGVQLTSMVFPRNQYSPEHLRALKRAGYTAFRGNERSRYYAPLDNRSKNTRMAKGVRLADSYLNLTGHHAYPPEICEGLVNLPASRFLRPYNRSLRALDGLRLRRIKAAMDAAARAGTTFHLWWHPHNFGADLAENIAFLDGILQHFNTLRSRGAMQSMTMAEAAQAVLQGTLSNHVQQ